MSSFPDQVLSLQHYISRLLPSSAHSDTPACLAAAIYKACQLSFHSLHPSERAKDEIWNLLRSASVPSPTPSQIDEIWRLVTTIHQRSSNILRNINADTPNSNDTRLSDWNQSAAAFFEHMVKTAGVGTRVYDPRLKSQSYSSTSTQQSSLASTSSVTTTNRAQSSSFAAAASSSQQPSRKSQTSGFDPAWLRNRCAQIAACRAGGATSHEMAMSVLILICDKSLSDEYLQSDLYDCFAGDFDAVADVLQKRAQIIANRDAITADGEQARQIHDAGVSPELVAAAASTQRERGVRGRSSRHDRQSQQFQPTNSSGQVYIRDVRQETLRKEQMRETRRLMKAGYGAGDEDEDDEDDFVMTAQDFSGSAYEERQRAFPGVQLQGNSVIGAVDRIGLPKGSTRELGKGYEEIFVPPPLRKPVNESELVDIGSALGEHPELLQAMKGVKTLNRLQSAVFPTAFKSDENMLVCAPTGAGKTNVALLTIFREIVAVKLREKRNFKVVYVAPMKALAAEVTEKFSHRLGPLGLTVREFTGDISPSRAETIATHVLVTTPEKWDVVTRKTGSEVGEALTLFIIDEIHLLHDERGAVLESIVARTLRFSETAQRPIRLVGLSATLPNYADVGSFMRVNPQKGLFHFDGSHRPVPLSQTFIGISEGQNSNSNEARRRKENKVHEMAWKKVKDSLLCGHQAMIFVHSRKGTSNAAREMLSRATQDALSDIFLGGKPKTSSKRSSYSNSDPRDGGGEDENQDEGNSVLPPWAAKEISKSKTADIRELCARGIGIHNAGLPRPDRKLVEKLFSEGIIRLLCCTATLAWGVNLPARTVVIMGTEVYNAEKGGFVQLGMLDVMQIFGRAGRPQFDTEGEGTIITDHEYLSKYLNMLTSSIPIESQLGASASRLADHLNAEIVSGTVSSIGDGVRWLSYTYLSVRMPQNPLVYGINRDEVAADSGLHSRRATLITEAAKALDDARMCRYDTRTGMLSPLDLGRVSSHFYVSHETIVLWTEQLTNFSFGPAITEHDWQRVYSTVIHAVASATEFEQMRSREEESEELEYLMRQACPIRLKPAFGSETKEGKVAILLQAHISRAQIRMNDLSYIIQSATRLLRSLFEISLRRGMPSFSVAALELARASESRIWPFQHPLWQFTYLSRRERGLLVTPETIAMIESSGQSTDLAALRSRSREELSELIRAPRIVNTVEKVLRAIPTLEIAEAKVSPLTNTLLSVHVKLLANFTWNDLLHGNLESWWLWIEDKEDYRIYHSQKILLTKRQVQELNGDIRGGVKKPERQTFDLTFTVAVFDPPSPHYWVRIESDRWHTGGGATATLTVANMNLPREMPFKSDISGITPSPVYSVMRGDEADWFARQFTHFSVAQTVALHTMRQTDENTLMCAPPGCGDLATAELAILRAFKKREDATVVVIVQQEGSLQKLQNIWKKLSQFGKGPMFVMDHVNSSSSSSAPRPESLSGYSIILATSETWHEYFHSVNEEQVVPQISTFILLDLHRMSDRSNIGTEFIISRLRRYRRKANTQSNSKNRVELPRIVAFSTVIPNALQVAEWLGVSRKTGLFCFGEEARQVAVETYLVSVAGDRYGSRMQSINRPLYSTIQRYSNKKPVLIFVSSRRQTLLTARDLLRLSSLDGKDNMFIGKQTGGSGSQDMARHLRACSDIGLRQVIPKGIGLYHENMSHAEMDAVEALFNMGRLLAVIATFGMAGRMSLRAQSVIIKGTETFNLTTRRYEDVSVSDIVYMIGQAGRVGVDSTGYATIFVHEPKQTLFKKLVHEPLPIESTLLDRNVEDALLREASGTKIVDVDDAVSWLKNTFFFQRLHTNPGFYGLKKSVAKKIEKSGVDEKTFEAERRNTFCKELITNHLQHLEQLGCVILETTGRDKKSITTVKQTRVGEMCSRWRIRAVSGSTLREHLGKLNGGEDNSKSFGLEEVMTSISCIEEIWKLGKDYEEDAVWKKLFDRIVHRFVNNQIYTNVDVAARNMKLNGWAESSQKRGKMLCYNVLLGTSPSAHRQLYGGGGSGGSEINVSAVDELKRRMVNVTKVLTRVICYTLDMALTIINSDQIVKQIVRAKQCLVMKRVPSLDFWTLCGDVVETNLAEKGRKEGWTSIDKVMSKEQEFSMFIANVCREEQRGAIMRWVKAFPKVQIRDISVTNVSNTNTVINVVVSVKSSGSLGAVNQSQEDSEHDDNGIRTVIVISNPHNGNVISTKRIRMNDKLGAASTLRYGVDSGATEMIEDVSFTVEETVDVIKVWVACEDWFGAEASKISNS